MTGASGAHLTSQFRTLAAEGDRYQPTPQFADPMTPCCHIDVQAVVQKVVDVLGVEFLVSSIRLKKEKKKNKDFNEISNLHLHVANNLFFG